MVQVSDILPHSTLLVLARLYVVRCHWRSLWRHWSSTNNLSLYQQRIDGGRVGPLRIGPLQTDRTRIGSLRIGPLLSLTCRRVVRVCVEFYRGTAAVAAAQQRHLETLYWSTANWRRTYWSCFWRVGLAFVYACCTTCLFISNTVVCVSTTEQLHLETLLTSWRVVRTSMWGCYLWQLRNSSSCSSSFTADLCRTSQRVLRTSMHGSYLRLSQQQQHHRWPVTWARAVLPAPAGQQQQQQKQQQQQRGAAQQQRRSGQQQARQAPRVTSQRARHQLRAPSSRAALAALEHALHRYVFTQLVQQTSDYLPHQKHRKCVADSSPN